jgi:hypothetical protein
MAERMLEARRKRFPQLIAAGRMEAGDAAAQLAVFEALAAEWRWMATGTGAPADHAMLPAITAALEPASPRSPRSRWKTAASPRIWPRRPNG